MEESKKKRIMVGIIVVCLGLAGIITFRTLSGGPGIPGHFAKEMTWVKCRNPDCGAGYEITKMEYFKYVQKHDDPRLSEAPPLVCTKCGQKGIYIAIKCEKCGLVFERGTIPGDFEDRCPNPECSYSKEEVLRKVPERE